MPRLPRKATWQPAWTPSERIGFAASPIDTAELEVRGKPETRDETCWSIKTSISCETSSNFLTLCSFLIDVFPRVFSWTLKFAMFRARLPSIFSTSRKMPRLRRNLHLSPLDAAMTDNAIRKKTRSMTRLKRCACHAKWRWWSPKCCACHEKCNVSSENVARVLYLPHKTTFDTLRNTSECHQVPRLPRETKQRDFWNLQKWPLLQNLPFRQGHTALTRTVADVCERLRNVERTHPQPPDPQSETGTLSTHLGKKKCNYCTNSPQPRSKLNILKGS